MGLKFNPFSGNFDFTGSGGGGASYIDGEVQNFSALPQTLGTPPVDSAYLVREAEGTWLINRKPAGIYIRTANTGTRASDWTHAGAFPDVFNDANFLLYDSADSTKNLAFQLSGITTGTTRTITVPDADVTLPTPSLLNFTGISSNSIQFATQELTLEHTGSNDTPYINVTDGTDYALLGVRQGDMFLQGSNANVRIEQAGGELANILMVGAKLEDDFSDNGHFATITADGVLTDDRTLTVPDASGTLPLLETANTFSANQTLNGTNNVAPNQTAASGSSLITRDLGDARHPQKMSVATTGVSNFYLADLLNSGTASSPGIGGFEGGGLTFQAASSTERLAFWRGATGAVTNQKTRAVLRGTNAVNQGIFWSANFAGTLTMRFRLNQTTDCQLTVGLSQPAAAGAGSIVDKIGAYVRYDASTDTDFMYQNGPTAGNAVSSGVAVDTNWHVVRIRVVSTTSVFYSLDGGAETQVTVSTGAASVSPAFFLMTTANTDKTADFSAVTLEATT